MSNQFTPEELHDVRARATRFATRFGTGFSSHVEDFASFAVQKAIERERLLLSFKWLINDYWETFVRKDPTYTLKGDAVLYEADDDDLINVEHLIASHPRILEDMLHEEFLNRVSKVMNDREWTFFILRFKHEFRSNEIMSVMRMGKSTASIMLGKVLRVVKEEMSK